MHKAERTIFCDLDGVLADFDQGFIDVMGKPIDTCLPGDKKIFWSRIASKSDYWFGLPPKEDYLELWDNIKEYNPIILTGAPYSGFRNAEQGKTLWCKSHLEENVQVAVVITKDKPKYLNAPGDILIDDNEKNCKAWEEAGGVAILHTSARDTIKRLGEILSVESG